VAGIRTDSIPVKIQEVVEFMIRSLFALIGFLSVILFATVFVKGQSLLDGFDPKAGDVYLELVEKIMDTGSIAQATAWKYPVADGLAADEVEETMKMVANELNLASVGDLPTSMDIEAKTGKPYRLVKIFMFCNSLTAKEMIDYDDAFSAYLPCRITMVEDKRGKLWLMAMNMDLMIYGGKPLPAELKTRALKVKDNILEIMRRGAIGDF
jgi:uncharacterized protein (DUF302 family)